jgi:branched-subunit amino acid transport protein
MSILTLWLTIVGAGAVTFALRLSFIAMLGRMEMAPPPETSAALRACGSYDGRGDPAVVLQ